MASESQRRKKRKQQAEKQTKKIHAAKQSKPSIALPTEAFDDAWWLDEKEYYYGEDVELEDDEEDFDISSISEELFNALQANVPNEPPMSDRYNELQDRIEASLDAIREATARRLLAKLFLKTNADDWLEWLLHLAYILNPEVVEMQIQRYRDLSMKEDLSEVDRRSALWHVRRLEETVSREEIEAGQKDRKLRDVPF